MILIYREARPDTLLVGHLRILDAYEAPDVMDGIYSGEYASLPGSIPRILQQGDPESPLAICLHS